MNYQQHVANQKKRKRDNYKKNSKRRNEMIDDSYDEEN